MLNFEALAEAKTAAQGINDKAHARFVDAYQAAVAQVGHLHELSCKFPHRRLPERELREAVDCLSGVIDLKPSSANAYALFSYLFFLMENLVLARKYLQQARSLNSDFPKIAELEALYNEFDALERLHSQLPEEGPPTPLPVMDLGGFDLPDL